MDKNILIISHGIDGGINRVSTDLFNYINTNTRDSCRLIRIGEYPMEIPFRPNEQEVNIAFQKKKGGIFAKIFSWMSSAQLARDAIGRRKFDIIVYSGIIPAVMLHSGLKKNATKSIFWEHGPQKTHVALKKIITQMLPTYDGLISPAQSSLDWLRENLNVNSRKYIVVSNWVFWGKISYRSQADFNYTTLKIIVASRIDFKQKDFSTLLLAIKEVLGKLKKPIMVDIYGQGPDEQSLKRIINFNGLEGNVNLKGHVADVYDRYKDYDLSILPTNWEGFGLSLAESMAAKVPVISASVEGVIDVIEDQVNGFLYLPGKPSSLAEKIVHYDSLSSFQRFQMGESGRSKVLAHYDPQVQLSVLHRHLVNL